MGFCYFFFCCRSVGRHLQGAFRRRDDSVYRVALELRKSTTFAKFQMLSEFGLHLFG